MTTPSACDICAASPISHDIAQLIVRQRTFHLCSDCLPLLHTACVTASVYGAIMQNMEKQVASLRTLTPANPNAGSPQQNR